jgi:hypothetical protein
MAGRKGGLPVPDRVPWLEASGDVEEASDSQAFPDRSIVEVSV